MRTLERGLAAVFLTVGLTVLLSVPLTGARPTLSNAEAGPTFAAIGGVVFTLLGSYLFVRVGRRNRKMADRIEQVVGFQEQARAFRKRAEKEGRGGDIVSVKAEADAWVDATHKWFQKELPTYAETFVRPTNAVIGQRHDLTIPASELVSYLTTFLENLADIVASLARERGHE